MSKNLILSAAVGYNFAQIEFFIKSLRKFYQDNVCIIIDNKDNFSLESYKIFLKEIGYLVDEQEDFKIETANVDDEIYNVYGK